MLIASVLIVASFSLALAAVNFSKVKGLSEGNEKMREISGAIREGAEVFLKDENRAVLKAAVWIALGLGVIIGWYVGVAFLLGAFMSFLAGLIGMKAATISNVRVAEEARKTKDISKALRVAYTGGSVMGLSVAGLALLGLGIVYAFFGKLLGQLEPESMKVVTNWLGINFIPFTMTVSGYALGCSMVAMFDRVGGGIYTKAADMAADLVGKTELGLPEDDPRNPATIADNVGDNVGDVAGLGADLLESFVGSMVAAAILGAYMYPIYKDFLISERLLTYPIVLATVGLLSSIAGILLVIFRVGGKEPQRELDIGLWVSALSTLVLGFLATYWMFADLPKEYLLKEMGFRYGWYSPWGAAALGVIIGILTGFWAEYYTSDKYRPTKLLSERSFSGVGLVITGGISLGMRSTFYPMITIVVGILLSSHISGLYGVAIAALGMLSFVATSVSVDSYGPIADNAGGISEMAGLEEEVRKITDKLDSVGNTTAAIGKGFAIGSAVLAALSLFISYVFSQMNAKDMEELSKMVLSGKGIFEAAGDMARLFLTSPRTITGVMVGAVLPYLFASVVMDAVTDSAKVMIEEIRRQFREKPGIKSGQEKPDYNSCISISNRAALKKMVLPAMIAFFTPVVTGLLLGPKFVGGLLLGATASGALVAITMANSGGAWDNAKKFLEQGKLKGAGKGSEEHKSLVVGDTVGDPMKDAAGPSINILIKIMSVVSILLASIFSRYHLF